MCIGVVPEDKWREIEFIGDHHSWGFYSNGDTRYQAGYNRQYGPRYLNFDRVAVVCDFDKCTISFEKNGRDLGVAFENLDGPVRVGVSMLRPDQSVTFIDN